MNNPSQYVENILLEILDRFVLLKFNFYFNKKIYCRPHHWIEREDSHKYNIQRFNAQKAAFNFLQQYQGRILVKAQKVNKTFFFITFA
jgi:hypothetical protein